MLPLPIVEEIRRMLDERLSQRKIAEKLGVSRGTVGAIASGRRGLYGREPSAQHDHFDTLEFTAERCAGCGAMVYKPCLLCRARSYRRRQRRLSENNRRLVA